MKKTIIIIWLSFFIFFFFPQISSAQNASRPLEIVYPEIPGVPTPQYVSQGLPEYVNYIFRFSIIVIGFLIFGVLIYGGANYLFSFGNPAKLSDARQGMTAAGLGGLILLGSYLIFNTINPQLMILKPPQAGLIKAVINAGVYLCNYKVSDISEIMSKYMSSDSETRLEGAKKLKEAIVKSDSEKCFRVNYPGILNEFYVKAGEEKYTLFIVPAEKYDLTAKEYYWEYEYGVILHENDKFGKQAKLFPPPEESLIAGNQGTLFRKIYATQPESSPLTYIYYPKLDFTAKSITVFKKPSVAAPTEFKGAILYEGKSFNQIPEETCSNPTQSCQAVNQCCLTSDNKPGTCQTVGLVLLCQETPPSTLETASFNVAEGLDIRYVTPNELANLKLSQNTRSIEIDKKNSYIAILLGKGDKCGENYEKSCEVGEVRKTSDNNLTDDPIGRCGSLCQIVGLINIKCDPCLTALYVIKGQGL